MDRFSRRGRLEELNDQIYAMKVKLDGLAKNIIYCFEPLDIDKDYVGKVNVKELAIHFKDFADLRRKYDSAVAQLESMKQDFGDVGT